MGFISFWVSSNSLFFSNNFERPKIFYLYSFFILLGRLYNLLSFLNPIGLNLLYGIIDLLLVHFALDYYSSLFSGILYSSICFVLFLLEGVDPIVHFLNVALVLLSNFFSLRVVGEETLAPKLRRIIKIYCLQSPIVRHIS